MNLSKKGWNNYGLQYMGSKTKVIEKVCGNKKAFQIIDNYKKAKLLNG